MDDRRLIPSMFHRRLVLLAFCAMAVVLLMGLQIVRLSVVEGAQRRAEAESRLDRRTYIDTYRGRVLDRHGRVLATDRASYDIAVDFEVINGSWEKRQAASQARQEIGRSIWNTMSPEQRAEAIRARLPEWTAKTERVWDAIQRLGGIEEVELLRRRDAIKREVHTLAATVWDQQRLAWIDRFGTDDDPDGTGFTPRPIREQREHHVILPRVSNDVAFEFRRMAADLGGIVTVRDARRRDYPWTSVEVIIDRTTLPGSLQNERPIAIRVEGVADHILGSVRDEVWEEDVERRPFVNPRTAEIDLGGYRQGDIVGSRGIELAFEDHLRGTRGIITERRDTGEERRLDPQPGDDLELTLDVALQARVQGLLSHDLGLTRVQSWHENPSLPIGFRMNSAAVVMDVETGEILAMVSQPTVAAGREMSAQEQRQHDPWVNRPAEAVYPPGSIIKPLVLAAAVQEGRHNLREPITCTGHFYEQRQDIARCWIYRERFGLSTHGSLRAEEALARSCNIFFYTLADRLGMARMSDWYRRFGLGSPLDVGLLRETESPDESTQRVGEHGGSVPDDETIARLRQRGELNFASVILGIGQGPITWTPVQAANAYATIARGGIIRDATLIPDQYRTEPRPGREHLGFSEQLTNAALEGLRQSVEETFGTGYQIRFTHEDRPPHRIMNAKGVTTWAKTGTAQAPPLTLDTTDDGEPDSVLRGLSHAWFVGLVGEKGTRRPQYAIAVVVEYGGSGGRVAGPIANEIVRALQRERYLPDPDRDGVAHGSGKGDAR